jgi:serine/threonine protein kinase
VNRFRADFASSLLEESRGQDVRLNLAIQACEMEEIPGYSIQRIIGRGSEAIVYEAVRVETQEIVAVKKLFNTRVGQGPPPREVIVARSIDHPHSVPVLDAFPITSGYAVVMPLCPFGSLEISSVPEITVRGAAILLYKLGDVLYQMHKKLIVHRDIKSGNILVFEDRWYALCDFSISVQLSNDDEEISGIAGTPVFMAPEISVNKYNPKPCDLWALGVTVYALLYGKYPWTLGQILEQPRGMLGGKNVAKNEVNGGLVFPTSPPIPDEMKNILCGLLEKDPANRMTAEELIGHPWLSEQVSEWEQMMNLLNTV